MRKQRGMSLVELVIYFALTIVCGLLLWAVNNLLWGGQRATEASYLVSGETEKALEWIRRDITETALASIEVFPKNPSSSGQTPGISFVSNRAFAEDEKGRPVVNRWGAPEWGKHVLYTLDREGAEPTGNLVRWEREIAPQSRTLLPVTCDVLPSSLPAGGQNKQKVLLRNVLAPNVTVPDAGPDGDVVTNGFGGFRVEFVQRDGGSGGAEMFTTRNPRENDANAEDNTRMLEVQLKLLGTERSKPLYYDITFRVAATH